jgi:hypothetical protein
MQPIVEQPVTNTHVSGVLGQQSLYPSNSQQSQGAVPSMASVSENFASTSHGGQMMSTAGEMFESPVVGQPPRVHETSGNENVFNSVVTDTAFYVNARTRERILVLGGKFVDFTCL